MVFGGMLRAERQLKSKMPIEKRGKFSALNANYPLFLRIS
jgi:hypothetical protein